MFTSTYTCIYVYRSDDWGGSYANRMRFPKEIVRRIRQATGPDFIIIYRYYYTTLYYTTYIYYILCCYTLYYIILPYAILYIIFTIYTIIYVYDIHMYIQTLHAGPGGQGLVMG